MRAGVTRTQVDAQEPPADELEKRIASTDARPIEYEISVRRPAGNCERPGEFHLRAASGALVP